MSDQKFAKKVARLNSNVLHLCFTQNTKIAVLHPMHTLQNLMHLLNTEISDLGRYIFIYYCYCNNNIHITIYFIY